MDVIVRFLLLVCFLGSCSGCGTLRQSRPQRLSNTLQPVVPAKSPAGAQQQGLLEITLVENLAPRKESFNQEFLTLREAAGRFKDTEGKRLVPTEESEFVAIKSGKKTTYIPAYLALNSNYGFTEIQGGDSIEWKTKESVPFYFKIGTVNAKIGERLKTMVAEFEEKKIPFRGTQAINSGTFESLERTLSDDPQKLAVVQRVKDEYQKLYSGTYSVGGLVKNQKVNTKFDGIISVNNIHGREDETLIRGGIPANVLVIHRGDSKIILPFVHDLASTVIPPEMLGKLDLPAIQINDKDVLEYNRLELLPEVKQGKTKQLLKKFNSSMKEIDKEQSRFRAERNRLSNLASSDLRTREPSQVRKVFAKLSSKFPDSRFSLPQR